MLSRQGSSLSSLVLPGQPNRLFTISSLASILNISLIPVRTPRIYLQSCLHSQKCTALTIIEEALHSIVLSIQLRSLQYHGLLVTFDDHLYLHLSNLPHPAVTSMMVQHSNCTLSVIMEGCFGKSDTVFASHYLRDISVTNVQGLQFGLLVLAQQPTTAHQRR